ncbi:hypothetical protein F5B22DRAFT_638889 [Xylaria bambusicola]|uniref:uncharacterized protein n=1 Tax=Xylaria bambusicola TaxID=326684 RepID=UPI002008415F|nr:uncharacterized protein F5B22DRAFT_638889 [Xylaria bambusicola]KAI0506920.1 hypothetical protein F5B22DRAFT_638889 [Xylaria bambusicola]
MAPEVTLTQQKCANMVICNKLGKTVCTGCYLVTCSPACQQMNWSIHKADCCHMAVTASFETDRRLPAWAPQNLWADLMRNHRRRVVPQDAPQIGPQTHRQLVEDDPRSGQFEMFGSYPAIDVLRLSANEGVKQTNPIDVLFVQPSDLRDVIKTIVDLPDDVSAPISIVITDDTTAKITRNLILLFMALSSDNPDVTAECAVSFWYASFIPKWCIPTIRELIGPFIDECQSNDQEESEMETKIARQWSFGSASLKAVLTRHMQRQGDCAHLDHYERTLMSFPPEWQAAKRRYMPSAQVTPFENYDNPANWPLDYNPSLFYGNFWPLKQDADPLRGWDLATINEEKGTERADNDIYGKLFYYVRNLFKSFILKLRTVNVTFHVVPYNGYDLAQETQMKFDRIETSALADENLVGVRTVVDTLSPLLKSPRVNPHATMITMHPGVFDKIQNAFPCPECDPNRAERVRKATKLTTTERCLLDSYLPLHDPDPVNWIFTAVGWQRRDARWLFRDPTAAWELYKDIYDFEDVADNAKVAMRTTHKVVSEWILRLKHTGKEGFDENGRPMAEAKRDFDAIFSRGQTAGYRYVEWRKLGPSERQKLEKKMKDARRDGHEPKRHEAYHEYLCNAAGLRKLEKKGSRLERWMGKDNHANWTPY